MRCGWPLLAALTPLSVRPYPDTWHGNVVELILGQNGFGRLGLGAAATTSTVNGTPGPWRLLQVPLAAQAGWLLPLALAGVLLAAVRLVQRRRIGLGWVVFGGWLVVAAVVLSFMRGAMHPYYTVLLAPAVAALSALVLDELGGRSTAARAAAALLLAGSLGYAGTLLRGEPSLAGILPLVLGAGLLAAAAVLGAASPRGRALAAGLAAAALAAGPAAYAATTFGHPVAGADPLVGPRESGGGHGPYPAEVVALLDRSTAGAPWLAAVPTATAAAALQLQSGRPVLPLGGFTGHGGFPAPPALIAEWAAQGKLRWLVLQGPYWSRDDPPGMRGTTTDAAVQWALAHGCPQTIGGTRVEVVDLTRQC